MNASSFFENIGPTMFFAFAGTFASTFVVGGIVYAAGQAGLCYPLGLLACLVFGSLISALTPIPTLTLTLTPTLSLTLTPTLSLSLTLALAPTRTNAHGTPRRRPYVDRAWGKG